MSAPVFQSLRGFKDVLPPESARTERFERIARDVLARFGFREIRLPTLEPKDLFIKSTGETTDIVEKEMYELEDAGGRRLALRPEGTPGVARALLQHHLHQQGARVKLYYVGSMFRAERPQAGRLREFEQIGAECFGNAHPAADAESMLAFATILDEAGLRGRYAAHINNLGCENPDCRPAFRARLLAYLKARESELCEHCRGRLDRNPLRVLDCKGDGPRLRKDPKLPQLTPCADCREHFDAVASRMLKTSDLRVVIDPSLVRGLDYYTRTVFEFKSGEVGAQDAVGGGGRYDSLVRSMGGPDIPAVGWALGVERTLMALGADVEVEDAARPFAYIAVQSGAPEIVQAAVELLQRLRKGGMAAEGSFFGHSLKAQLREADRLSARFAVILAEDEFKRNQCLLKNLQGSADASEPSDSQRAIPLEEVANALQTYVKETAAS